MSTLRVNTLQNTATTDGGISIDSSGHVTVDGVAYPSAGSLSGRNRIINGDMRIDQRNDGASVNMSAVVYPVDRWVAFEDTDGAMTAQRSTTAPAGFANSIVCTTTTADASLAAAQYARILQSIEGYNVADLMWGTANAQSISVSFWVRSSLTGTFGGSIANSAFDRSYPFTYAVSAANTWEYKTIVIPGDTTGTWLTDNGTGLQLNFSLGAGTTFSGTAGSWAGSGLLTATGATSVVGTNGATFYVTGVQLEAGTVATPFERRSYGQELSLCQRYYQALGLSAYSDKFPTTNGTVGNATIGTGSNYAVTPINFPVPMRAVATVVFAGVTSTTGEIRNSATGATYPVTSYEATSKGLIMISATGIASGTPLHYQFSATAEL